MWTLLFATRPGSTNGLLPSPYTCDSKKGDRLLVAPVPPVLRFRQESLNPVDHCLKPEPRIGGSSVIVNGKGFAGILLQLIHQRVNLIHQPHIKTLGILVINQIRYTVGYALQPTNIIKDGLDLTTPGGWLPSTARRGFATPATWAMSGSWFNKLGDNSSIIWYDCNA